MSMFHIVCQQLKILQCFNVLQMCMEFTVVCNRVYLHKVYVHFDSLVMYTCTSLRMQLTCISPLCKIYDFALSDGNRKTQKRMVFLLPFVGRTMDSQNKGRHQRCPSVDVSGMVHGVGNPCWNPWETHTKTNRKGLKNGAWKNHGKTIHFPSGSLNLDI